MSSDPVNASRIYGSIPALVTPFRDGALDEDAYARLIERQIAAGSNGLAPAGTTGESATLSEEEHVRVIKMCVAAANGRAPVIAGVGANDTAQALRLARAAADAGADALLAVCGYYNRPSPAGLAAHYEALAAATDLPVIYYNVPARTGVDAPIDLLARLSKNGVIAGVKDASGDLARVALYRVHCKAGFAQLSGEDITAVGYNAMGGRGCISVTANVAPALCAQMQTACREDDFRAALAVQDKLTALHDALFSDRSPGPVKFALAELGLCAADLRAPLAEPSDASKAKVRAALSGLDLG